MVSPSCLFRWNAAQVLSTIVILQAVALPALGATTSTTGVGSAVTVADRSATFDSLSTPQIVDLASYTENLLRIQTQVSVQNYWSQSTCGSTGCWYPYGGETGGLPNVIAPTDGLRMEGVEFTSRTGGSASYSVIRWETYRNDVLTGEGNFTWQGVGTVLGWSDAEGIDELRVGLFDANPLELHNPLAIDDLRVQLAATPPVPEPATYGMMMLGLALLGWHLQRVGRNENKSGFV